MQVLPFPIWGSVSLGPNVEFRHIPEHHVESIAISNTRICRYRTVARHDETERTRWHTPSGTFSMDCLLEACARFCLEPPMMRSSGKANHSKGCCQGARLQRETMCDHTVVRIAELYTY